MLKNNRPAVAVFRFTIAILSLIGLAACFDAFGLASIRVFIVWALTITATYYVISGFVTLLARRRPFKNVIQPMFLGLILVNLLLASSTAIFCALSGIPHPMIGGGMAVFVYGLLPLLVLADWIFFTKKGLWRPGDPFYWLALPAAYAGVIISTAVLLPSDLVWRFPLPFFNTDGDLLPLVLMLAIFLILILAVGYLFWLFDALASGFIGQHIVLPHIKTVEIEDSEADAGRR